jgi:two-component system, NarL family, nitrate/nitrite response regulator NarL
MADPPDGSTCASVLVVDDHALFAECLALVLRMQGFDPVETLTEDLGRDRVLAAAADFEPDVILLDLYLGAHGLGTELISPLKALPATVLMLSASEDRSLLAKCLEEGADGLFDKARSFEQLVDDLEDAASGRSVLVPEARAELLDELREQRRAEQARRRPLESLTGREAEILAELMSGKSAEQIAEEGGVAPSTVRTQIKSILRKLGVNSQLAAVALAHAVGWRPS